MPFADLGMIEKALTHIVENAITFTPEKGWVKLNAVATKVGIRVSVIDNGVGISEADRERVFEAFFKGDRSRGQSRKGNVGLGLTTARDILALHGSHIQIKPRKEGGTIVYFDLPLKG